MVTSKLTNLQRAEIYFKKKQEIIKIMTESGLQKVRLRKYLNISSKELDYFTEKYNLIWNDMNFGVVNGYKFSVFRSINKFFDNIDYIKIVAQDRKRTKLEIREKLKMPISDLNFLLDYYGIQWVDFNDITGERFGRLVALRKLDEKHPKWGSVMFEFKCDCGDITKHAGSDVKRGSVQSCGCLAKETSQQAGRSQIEDIVGKRFGTWTVMELLPMEIGNKGAKWMCKCDCGTVKMRQKKHLTGPEYPNCGCVRQSLGEQEIQSLLQEHNIKYYAEKTFPDLLSDRGGHMRCDFYLEGYNTVIEFHGKQHYKESKRDWGENNTLESIQHRDKMKKDYALKNGMTYIVIPYTQRGKIKIEDLIEVNNYEKI